jgi:DNA-binding response OmpR family regulator
MVKGAKVLVVDDEVVFSELMSVTFKDAGFQVECASTGKRAIEEGRRFKPDLLFCDWQLRDGTTGLDVAKALRRENPRLKIVVVTGLADRAEAALRGFPVSCLIEKPCDSREVVKVVRALV